MSLKMQTICIIILVSCSISSHRFDLFSMTPGAEFPDYQISQSPPKGFVPLFNGKDLTGWKGLVGDPVKRSQMSPDELAKGQARADSIMRTHWKVENGVLAFDGDGFHHICTAKDYGDFELLVDWKINKDGDSGIYLRGCPQVQIWDIARGPEGSGGLYNNQKHPSKPSKCADRSIGEWNTFRIRMIDERVTVYLNGELVVDNVVMENYWERHKPIYPTGQIELQAHNTPLYFRNIYIKEIPRNNDWRPLFNGKNFEGWTGATDGYLIEDGNIVCPEHGGGNLFTKEQFSDFIFRFEFRLTPGANNGLGVRTPLQGDAAYVGMELQILDDAAEQYQNLKPYQYHGSIYGVVPSKRGFQKPVGEWNFQEVIARGRQITVNLNGETIVDVNLGKIKQPVDGKDHPGLKRKKGHIGFLGHGSRVEFRNIMIKTVK